MRREVLHTAGYVAIQLGAVASSLVAMRWGSRAFGVAFALGAMLAMGWGATLTMLLTPSLPARMWTMPFGRGVRASAAGLAAAAAIAVVVTTLPASAGLAASLAGIAPGSVLLFLLAGTVRHTIQVATTFQVRQDLHTRLLGAQALGRVVELALLGFACREGSASLFWLAWMAYPAFQLLSLGLEPRVHHLPPSAEPGRGSPRPGARSTGEAANLASSLLDLVVPTLWLRLGGEAAYVAYRAMTAVVGYVVLLPRYWYVVVSTSRDVMGERGRSLTLATMALSLAGSFCYQWTSGLVPVQTMIWSAIPVLCSAGAAPTFSRLRQACLRRGDITSPAAALVAGRVVEGTLLLLLGRVLSLGPHLTILAYCGTATGALLLRWRVEARAGSAVGA